jgi:hypothetical protein
MDGLWRMTRDAGPDAFQLTGADPQGRLCRFNMETLWSDPRFGVVHGTVADRKGRKGETVYPIAIS